jgi:ribosomal protein S18 acetylase RimI-like enzyme
MPPVSFAISDLEVAEIDAAVSLWETCGLTRSWNDAREDARLALAGSTSTILAGRIAGGLVASAMVGADGHRGWVYYLAIAPDARGQGLGEAMMRAAERWAAQRGMPKLQLMVRHDNAGAKGFYEAIGYTSERVTVYARRFGGGAGQIGPGSVGPL